jgi:hypothetical protein
MLRRRRLGRLGSGDWETAVGVFTLWLFSRGGWKTMRV